jgi:hypothetical protein
VAAMSARREQDEALAVAIGRAVVRELAEWFASGATTGTPPQDKGEVS